MTIETMSGGRSVRDREPLIRPDALAPSESGTLVQVTPALAQWEYIGFAVRRVAAGEAHDLVTGDREVCVVLLSGHCRVEWDGAAPETIGPRENVFASYPHAVYLPTRTSCRITALVTSEIAECEAPSKREGSPAVVRPEQCGFEIRGGGCATRQIVDILPPEFPADNLLICEVFTPGGNWSSYPPHKHDEDRPPSEVILEETYYFRMRDPRGYAFQRIYTADGGYDETFKVEDGDLLLIHDGYHPFATAYGYDAYYLNVLAGPRRMMVASDDPKHARFRATWPEPDPRVPLVKPPGEDSRT